MEVGRVESEPGELQTIRAGVGENEALLCGSEARDVGKNERGWVE